MSLSAGALTTPTAAAGSHTINNNIIGGGSLTLASVAGGGTGATATLIFTGAANTTVTGAISQAATAQALTKSGAGTLTLNGASAYTGPTSVSAGILSLSGSLTGSNISTSGSGAFSQTTTGSIAGTGVTFTQNSTVTSTLANANTYTGTTTLSSGFLRLDHATAIPGGIGSTGGISALTLSGASFGTVLGLGAGDFTRAATREDINRIIRDAGCRCRAGESGIDRDAPGRCGPAASPRAVGIRRTSALRREASSCSRAADSRRWLRRWRSPRSCRDT